MCPWDGDIKLRDERGRDKILREKRSLQKMNHFEKDWTTLTFGENLLYYEIMSLNTENIYVKQQDIKLSRLWMLGSGEYPERNYFLKMDFRGFIWKTSVPFGDQRYDISGKREIRHKLPIQTP